MELLLKQVYDHVNFLTPEKTLLLSGPNGLSDESCEMVDLYMRTVLTSGLYTIKGDLRLSYGPQPLNLAQQNGNFLKSTRDIEVNDMRKNKNKKF